MNTLMMAALLSIGAGSQSSLDETLGVEIVSMLADDYVIGVAEQWAPLGGDDESVVVSGRLLIRTAASEEWLNVTGASPSSITGVLGQEVYAYYRLVNGASGQSRSLVVRPVLGAIAREDGLQLRSPDALRKDGMAFIESAGECPSSTKRLLADLAGRRQQHAVDQLFGTKVLSSIEVVCLVRAISSKEPVMQGSFAPPYWSTEGVYHHRFRTLGNLVAYLLPLRTGCKLYPRTFPMQATDPDRLIAAWGYLLSRAAADGGGVGISDASAGAGAGAAVGECLLGLRSGSDPGASRRARSDSRSG